MQTIVAQTIYKYKMLTPGGSVLAAVSGGADSMAMLHCLVSLGYAVHVLHIEHGIRGEASRRDADFVREYCKKHAVPFRVVSLDVPAYAAEKGLNTEQAARILRYQALRAWAAQLDCPIAVAHHQNDQAETVLLHLLRGSGLEGLCGMQSVNGDIIRPLLFVSREDILAYCRENSLAFVTDETNSDTLYTRNRIRHELLPLLESYNPRITQALCRTAELLSGDAQALEAQTEQLSKELLTCSQDSISLPVKELESLLTGLRRRLVRKAIFLLQGPEDTEQQHIDAVLALPGLQSGKKLHISKGLLVKHSAGKLLFYKTEPQKNAFTLPFEVGKTYDLGSRTVFSAKVDSMEANLSHCAFLDADKLPSPLTLRSRQTGDYIYPLGMEGKCALKKYLIDHKIPAETREELVLLAHDSEILAVVGHFISRKAAVEAAGRNILKITIREKN